MRKSLFMSVLAMGILSGCQNNMENLMETTLPNSTIVVNASLDVNAESRTSLTEESTDVFKVLWSAEDKLGIFYYSPTAHNKFKLTDGAGESNAEFENDGPFKVTSGTESGNASNFACVGYYPYDENTTATINSDGSYTIGTAIAVNQSYAANSFGADNFPMVAVSDNLNFSFKNVASVLRMPLKGTAKIVKATLTSQSKKIAGPYSVKMAEEDGTWTPSIDGEGLGITDGGSSMIVLECAEAVQLQANTATNFLFVIPPGTYAANDLVVKFYDDEYKYYSTPITAENTFVRSKVKTFKERTYEGQQKVGIAEANDALKAGVENVDVTIADTDENPTLNLPATTSENPTNINFQTIPTDAIVKIQASTENDDEAQNVNLSVPESQEGYSFDINLPNSTVALNANDGKTANYKEVTAITAQNTLIVGKDVTVNSLIVKQGHVRVHGTISNISRGEGNPDAITYIIVEEGAEIPETPGENFKVVSAAEYDFRKAIEKGGKVTLQADVTLTGYDECLSINTDCEIDLNGHNITHGQSTVIKVFAGGKLTIGGTGVVETKDPACGAIGNYGGTLIIDGGTYKSDEAAAIYCDRAVPNKERKGTWYLTINDGTFVTTSQSAVALQNNRKNDEANYEDGKAIINGGTFTGGGGFHDLYFANVIADITPSKCTFTNNKVYLLTHGPAIDGKEGTWGSIINGQEVTLKDANGMYLFSDKASTENELRAAVAVGGKVTLGADINLTGLDKCLSIYNDCEIDLNGHNITHTESTVIKVFAGGKLTIGGTGTVETKDAACGGIANLGGTLIINGGTYQSIGTAAIYCDRGKGTTWNLTIENGKFISTGGTAVSLQNNNGESAEKKGLATIKKGEFKGATGWHDLYLCNVIAEITTNDCKFEQGKGIWLQTVNESTSGGTKTYSSVINNTSYTEAANGYILKTDN